MGVSKPQIREVGTGLEDLDPLIDGSFFLIVLKIRLIWISF